MQHVTYPTERKAAEWERKLNQWRNENGVFGSDFGNRRNYWTCSRDMGAEAEDGEAELVGAEK